MPIFKVTAIQETRETYLLYVDAPNADEAETYVAGLPHLSGVRGANGLGEEDAGGEVSSVDAVDATPDGTFVLTAAWRGGIAVQPAFDDAKGPGGGS